MLRLHNNWMRVLPVLLVMGSIFYLSQQPGNSLSLPPIPHIDKFLHWLAYTALGSAYLAALPPPWRRQYPWLAGISMVLFCLFYGVSDEFHQSFVPGRFVSGGDLLADTLGGISVLCGVIAWRKWGEKKGRNNEGARR